MSVKVFSDASHTHDATVTRGAVVIYKDGVCIDKTARLGGPGWSDVAEYTAILLGLERLIELGLQQEVIQWFNDSSFVMGQMSGRMRRHKSKAYYPIAMQCVALLPQFKQIYWHWIPREQNKEADALSKIL